MASGTLYIEEIRRYLRVLRVNIAVIGISALLCLFIGVLVCFIVMDSGYGFHDMHEATASVYSRAGGYYGNEAAVVRYAEMAQSLRVADAAARLFDGTRPDKHEIQEITDVYYGDNGPYSAAPAVVYIRVRHPDPDFARDTANAVAKAFAAEVLAVDADSGARVLDYAEDCEVLYTAYGRLALFAGAGVLAGLIISLTILSVVSVFGNENTR